MADDASTDEIDDLVAQAKAQEDGDAEEGSEGKKPRKKRRSRRSESKKSDEGATGPSKTLDEMDVDELLPQGLPKPEQNIKGLGDLYAKYGVGERPEFKVHLYRTYPKIAPGGVKFDGFYDEYDIPITEQQVQADYGGGQYRIVVVGPHPTNPRLPKNYGSHSIGLAGEPNWDRMPRALQGKKKAESESSGNPPPLPMMPTHENPKLAEAALKMFQTTANAEREERRRMEEKMDAAAASRGAGSDAVAEAERRRADDLIRAERERAESERTYMEKRMDEIKREAEEQRRRFEMDAQRRPSMVEEIGALAQSGIFRQDDGTTKAMLEQVLGKHRDEISAIHDAHREFTKSLREGHQAEIAALRAAHQREMEAERAASRSREERIEERLRSEREERERDRVRHREAMEERDRHWKDRMEGQLQMQQSSWESRHQSAVSTYENRLQWMQQEIDKLKSENYDLRTKQEEKGDFFTQLSKHREVSTFLKGFSGAEGASAPASSSGGGIGLTGGGDDWKQTLAEGLSERAPQIMEKLFGGGGVVQQTPQPPPQQMQEFHEGQVVDTPQGKMEVVRNPADGQLALAPKEALDRHRAAIAAQQAQGGGLLPSGPPAPPRPAAKPNGKVRRRSRGVAAVPNLAEGLPRRRPPWEGGGEDVGEQGAPPPPPPVPPSVPRAATRRPEQPIPSEPIELSAIERQGIQVIAKEVHESVQQADEPEEFVHKMMEKYSVSILQQLVGAYSDRQVVQGITQLQPGSAGATPAGRQFVMQAFRLLREAVAS